jgi:hypothetical protein
MKDVKIGQKRKASNDDIEEVKVNKYERDRLENVLNRQREFWKLRRNLYSNQLFMCSRCRNYNYHLGDSAFQTDKGKSAKTDRVFYRQSLCRACVLWNLDMQDLQLRHSSDVYPDYIIKKH